MPGSSILKRVSVRHQTPGSAIWLSVVVAFVAAIYSGAYQTITSLSVIGLYFSYVIPVLLLWWARMKGRHPERGPWHLGRFSTAINIIAILWVIFISVILSLPDGMRAGRTMLGFTLLLALFYILRERRRFPGPAWMHNRKS